MGSRKKESIYSELGDLLYKWRAAKYRSALAMYRAGSFSFSYAAYADFERGAALPPPAALLEICQFLGGDEKRAFVVWVRIQMPSDELRSLFSPEKILNERKKHRERRDQERESQNLVLATDPRIHQQEFENTWVFGVPERDAILKEPKLMEMFIQLSIIHPRAIHLEDVGLVSAQDQKNFIEKHLNRWIQEHRIELRGNEVRLVLPHIYMPKNEVFDEIRKVIVGRALEKILPELTVKNIKSRTAHRTTANRYVTVRQRDFIMEKLAGLEREFSRLPYDDSGRSDDPENYTLLMFFARRKLEWPGE